MVLGEEGIGAVILVVDQDRCDAYSEGGVDVDSRIVDVDGVLEFDTNRLERRQQNLGFQSAETDSTCGDDRIQSHVKAESAKDS